MLKAIDEIRRHMTPSAASGIGEPYLSDPRYKAIPFSDGNFRQLEGEARHIASVDGGNAELIGGASVSIQLVRAYANVFEKNKCILREKHEFLCLTQAVDGATFEARLLPLRGGLLQEEGIFRINASEIVEAEERTKASQVGALTRRFAEWALCEKIIGGYDDIVVVKDGTLQTSVAKEAFYAKRAFEKTGKTKALAALSKTSTLLTTTGRSATDAVQSIAPGKLPNEAANPAAKHGWAYCWLFESSQPDHPANIGVAKLHPKSRRVFRAEVYKENTVPWKTLAENSRDPSFLGYPYALIDADRNARVTEKEASSLKGLVLAKLGSKAESISGQADAHEWLSKL